MIFCSGNIFSQNKIEQFRQFYNDADFAYYEQKIQQDLNKFDKWYIDSLPLLDTLSYSKRLLFKPNNVDLKNENKIFALAVSLKNKEDPNIYDNIYDHLIIDSLRTFIIVCVDDKMNVTGMTDIEKPGVFIDLKDNFYYSKKNRNRLRKIIKNIKKEDPEIIMYCYDLFRAFLYLKNNKLYRYDINTEKSQELHEYFTSSLIMR